MSTAVEAPAQDEVEQELGITPGDGDIETQDDEDLGTIALSTEILPAKKIKVDGEEYELLSFDHISPETEAQVTALFARFQRTYQLMAGSPKDDKAVKLAKQLRRYRELLIAKMTTIPLSKVKQYHPGVQGKLLEAIEEETGEADEDSSDTEASAFDEGDDGGG